MAFAEYFFILVHSLISFQCSSAVLQQVTCGSLVKLVNSDHRVRLHSHEVKYGSGSGQQSVTGMTDVDDSNSYWQVLGKLGEDCKRGDPIPCGSTVRILHVNTHRYLHTHLFQAPMSNEHQEVSAFGEDGQSDRGDNWEVVCRNDYWQRDEEVMLKHLDTAAYLGLTGQVYGRPIKGQYEVAATKSAMRSCYWNTAEGVYIKPDDGPQRFFNRNDDDDEEEHDEL